MLGCRYHLWMVRFVHTNSRVFLRGHHHLFAREQGSIKRKQRKNENCSAPLEFVCWMVISLTLCLTCFFFSASIQYWFLRIFPCRSDLTLIPRKFLIGNISSRREREIKFHNTLKERKSHRWWLVDNELIADLKTQIGEGKRKAINIDR